ncbi:MAG: hypothetical protein ABIH23_30495 [bacterium]
MKDHPLVLLLQHPFLYGGQRNPPLNGVREHILLAVLRTPSSWREPGCYCM